MAGSGRLTEIVKYDIGQVLFKGNQDCSRDPLITPSAFSAYIPSDNMFKWFTDDYRVAELYARGPSGCVWMYMLRKPMYLMRFYNVDNEEGCEGTAITLNALSKAINTYGKEFFNIGTYAGKISFNACVNDNLKADVEEKLKLPFGLISAEQQHQIIGIKDNGVIKRESGLLKIKLKNATKLETDYQLQMLQRQSHHQYDKYLTIFLKEYKKQIKELYLAEKGHTTTMPTFTLDGYTAHAWPSKWHNNFHSELCIYETGYESIEKSHTPIVFIGKYKAISGKGRMLVDDNGTDFVDTKFEPTKAEEIKNALGTLNNSIGMELKTANILRGAYDNMRPLVEVRSTHTGGKPKRLQKGGTQDDIFGEPKIDRSGFTGTSIPNKIDLDNMITETFLGTEILTQDKDTPEEAAAAIAGGGGGRRPKKPKSSKKKPCLYVE